MMNENIGVQGGWVNTGLRNILNGTIYPSLPNDLKNTINSKTLRYETCNSSSLTNLAIGPDVTDYLWLPTLYELQGSYYKNNVNNTFSHYFLKEISQHQKTYETYINEQQKSSKFLKTLNGKGVNWWFSSPHYDHSYMFRTVNNNGSVSIAQYKNSNNYYVPLCFVI